MKGMVEARAGRQQPARDGLVLTGLIRGGWSDSCKRCLQRHSAPEGEGLDTLPALGKLLPSRETDDDGAVTMWRAPYVSLNACNYLGDCVYGDNSLDPRF